MQTRNLVKHGKAGAEVTSIQKTHASFSNECSVISLSARRRHQPSEREYSTGSHGSTPPRVALYTFIISAVEEHRHLQVIGAMVAESDRHVRRCLIARYGTSLAEQALVRVGFDGSEPLACALVSEAMVQTLELASQDPTSSLAQGLDYRIEQRFDH